MAGADRSEPWNELVEGLRAQVEVLGLTRASGVPEPAPSALPVVPTGSAAPAGGGVATLEAIRADIGDCTRCKLCQKRQHIVFGQGNPRAELVFVGEGPGEEEDRQGLAFVGKAGELLTRMIGAMGLTRDQVYICNIVKCRPPNNRDPEPDEVAACEPFLRAQLAAIRPKVIVALGRCAAQTLLGVKVPISRLRGKWASYQEIPLMPTFHPAYLLRDASQKRPVWEDLKDVMRRLGRTAVDGDRGDAAGAGASTEEEP